MKKESKGELRVGEGTFTDKVHLGELRQRGKYLDRDTSEGQNLAGKKGIDGAKELLLKSYRKK